MRASIESLEEIYPGRGREAFNRIALLSGAGSLGSMGMGDTPAGIDLTGYADNDAIPEESRDEITKLLNGEGFDDEEEGEVWSPATVQARAEAETLAKKYNREELDELARQAGLDGNAHTNKTELAAAILATGFTVPE